jgi:hypothetical protein
MTGTAACWCSTDDTPALRETVAAALFQDDVKHGGMAEIDRERSWHLYLSNADAVLPLLTAERERAEEYLAWARQEEAIADEARERADRLARARDEALAWLNDLSHAATTARQRARAALSATDPGSRVQPCPTKTPEPHQAGEFPLTCYRCHVEADS